MFFKKLLVPVEGYPGNPKKTEPLRIKMIPQETSIYFIVEECLQYTDIPARNYNRFTMCSHYISFGTEYMHQVDGDL